MSGTTDYAVQAHYEEHPSRASRQVTVLVKVTAAADAPRATVDGNAHIAEAIVLDRSGSMADPRTKLLAAQDAACAAVDTLPDGAMFAVLEGTYEARMVYPKEQILAPLSARIREDTKDAIRALQPSTRGTVIGSWLDGVRELFEPYDGLIRHTTLLTDGRNQHQTREDLDRAIEACRGVLSCDARGIGEDWDGAELLHIVEALHGSAPALSAVGDLTADFTDLMRGLMGKAIPELTLRVVCGRGVTLAGAEQFHPSMMDMAQHMSGGTGRLVDFALGPWAAETRDYILEFAADPNAAPANPGHRIAAIELLAGADRTRVTGQRFVDVRWIDMVRPRTEIETRHELYRDLTRQMRAGCRAWLDERTRAALSHWLRARALAEQLNDAEARGRLDLVLRGDTVRPGLTREIVNQVLLGSTRTGLPEAPKDLPGGSGTEATVTCPECDRIAPHGAKVCERCGHKFTGGEAGTA